MSGITGSPTNVEWLQRIFGSRWESASVTAFWGDPGTADGAAWRARPAGVAVPGMDPSLNNYFALSLFTSPTSRRNAEFEGLYVLGVDDVGTKVDGEPIRTRLGDPTLELETSPGNWQWFYALSAPVMDPDTARKLLRLFGSDARDATRYMRLPVGRNGKPSVPSGWSGGCVYRPGVSVGESEVFAAMAGAVPAVSAVSDPFVGLPASGSASGAAGGGGTGGGQGHAPGAPLEGYIKAGTIPVGERDNTLTRFHGHAAKAWRRGYTDEAGALSFMGRVNVRLAGGSDKDFAGKWERMCRAEGMAARMTLSADACALEDDGSPLVLFGPPGPGVVADEFGPVSGGSGGSGGSGTGGLSDPFAGLDAGPVDVDALERWLLSDYVYVKRDDSYAELSSGELLAESGLNSTWNARAWATGLTGYQGKGKGAQPVPVGVWMRNHGGKTVVARCVSRVGEGRFRDTPTGREVNVAMPWPGLPVGGSSVSVAPWLRMLVNVSGRDRVVASHLADWLAWLVCNIAEKPGWHVMLQGVPGIGKDEVLVPIERWLERHARSVSLVDIEKGTYNGFASARLVRLDEAITTERGGQIVYSEIKRYTSTNNAVLMVNEKFKSLVEVKDLSGWWITSNEGVPLPLTENDRRFLVCEGVRARDTGVVRVARWRAWALAARTPEGVDAVVGWLAARWASMSDARRANVRAGDAPMTAAKIAVARAAEHPVTAALRVAIAPGSSSGWGPVMSAMDMKVDLATNGAVHGLSSGQRGHVTLQQVAKSLRELGCTWVKGGAQIGLSGSAKKVLWCLRPGMAAAFDGMGHTVLLGLAVISSAPRGAAAAFGQKEGQQAGQGGAEQ